MNLEFRELTLDDISAIKKMSATVGPLNDPDLGEIAEFLIRKPTCFLYGAFREKKLVGVGCLTNKSENYAWIEYIRVHGDHQKKGIGTALFKYGEDTARKKGYKQVAYSTVTGNKGSCWIGEKLNFLRAIEMLTFCLYPKNCPKLEDKYLDQKPIKIEEALDFLGKIPNGPQEEICTAWNFDPLEKEFFENQKDMKFFVLGETALLQRYSRDENTKKISYIYASLYGSKKNAKELLSGFIKRNADKNAKLLLCLCPENIAPVVLEMGFNYGTIWTGERNIVVLFKKYLTEA